METLLWLDTTWDYLVTFPRSAFFSNGARLIKLVTAAWEMLKHVCHTHLQVSIDCKNLWQHMACAQYFEFLNGILPTLDGSAF